MHLGPWEIAAYIGLWTAAFMLAADVGLRMAPNIRTRFPTMEYIQESGWWGFTPLILLTISGAIFSADSLGVLPKQGDLSASASNPYVFVSAAILAAVLLIWRLRRSSHGQFAKAAANKKHFPITDWDKPLEKRFRIAYKNETVDMDGLEFIECTFENCTFRYQGTRPFRLVKTKGNLGKVTTDNPVVGESFKLITGVAPDNQKVAYDIYTTGSR